MTQATRVVRRASALTRVMKTVPARWYAKPQRPKIRAIPDRPAAIEMKMRVNPNDDMGFRWE